MNPMLSPVTAVAGIGEAKARDLAELGINTVGDLLYYFPSRYEDYTLRDPRQVAHGDRITIRGTVYGEPSVRFFGKKRSRMVVRLVAERSVVTAVWFNQHYLKERLKIGREIQVSGKWDRHRAQVTVMETKTKISEADRQNAGELKIEPIYPVSASVTVKQMRRYVERALKQFGADIPEILPSPILNARRFISRSEAISEIHFPTSTARGAEARKRLAYEELFLYQLKMQAIQRMQKTEEKGIAMRVPLEKTRAFVRSLPFRLTNAQKFALKEILDDLRADYAMNRLLQGDVGSGKTVVAAVALHAAAQAGYQGALMAPTEILAEQHTQTLTEWLVPHGVQVALLTGGMSAAARRDTLAGLQMGLIDVVVGTHALIQEAVHFNRLGLVITDEQHRFGVEQRKTLREKGLRPNALFMTATPIPRTLALSVFADMDVSTLDELPAGRKPVETYWVKEDRFERVLSFIKRELTAGRQAYVICPLIEESDKLDVQNAIDMRDRLVQYFQDQFEVGLLHGRLSVAEKERVMKDFSDNRIQILVATTVVEVGVDVPNATVMVIYDAERFGLAQLHQLRGRVGRGSAQSTCILIADPKTEVGRERMRIMKETNDGFEIARRDLRLRGPGDFFGTKQSGLPEFRVADLTRDYEQLERARVDAARLLETDRFWRDEEYASLRAYLDQQGVFESRAWD